MPEIQSGPAESVLAKLYRRIIADLSIPAARFDQLITRYIQRTYPDKNSTKEVSSLKSTLFKELMKNKITFKVFLKGLQILNIRKFELVIRLHHANGHITEHGCLAVIGDAKDDAAPDTREE